MSPEIDEIILQIRKNNEEALELLFVCFEKHFAILENRMLYQYRLRGFSREDLRQIISEDMLKIIRHYEIDKGLFFVLWKKIETRNLLHLFQKNAEIALYEDSENCYDFAILDFLLPEDERNGPLDRYIREADYHEQLEKIAHSFSAEDAKILRMWSEGYSYEEIAAEYRVPLQRITYLLHRAFVCLKKTTHG